MLNLATTVKSIIRHHGDSNCRTDSLVSALHYKATVGLFLICCAIVSSHQYFGSPIDCIQDINGDDAVIPANVINNYCFIMATYTQRLNADGHLSNIVRNDKTAQLHAYYQWVPIVLFLQAVIFTVPRAIWKLVEGDLMSGCLASFDTSTSFPCEQTQHIPPLAKYISQRIHYLRIWGLWHVAHDVGNFFNVILNIYFMDIFLGEKFLSYGIETSQYLLGRESQVSPLDENFPKLTKCEFYKYGPSGTLQRHDIMCLMAMNIVNEKIFYILWLWLIFLALVTGTALFLRLFKILLLSYRFKFPTLRRVASFYDDSGASRILLDNFYLSDIIFLEQLKVNMDKSIFKKLIASVALILSNNIFESEMDYGKFSNLHDPEVNVKVNF